MTTDQPIRLRRTNPVDGHRDSKLHCLNEADWWAEHDGVVFIVENRAGVCSITPDLDLLHRLAGRHETYDGDFHRAVMAWLGSVEYEATSAIAYTLRAARGELAGIVTGPGWPAGRDAYRALLAWARGECPGSDRAAGAGTGRPICPVCHRASGIGLPALFTTRTRTPGNRPVVPSHPARLVAGPRFLLVDHGDGRHAIVDRSDPNQPRAHLTPRKANPHA